VSAFGLIRSFPPFYGVLPVYSGFFDLLRLSSLYSSFTLSALSQFPANLYSIRHAMGCFHVLVEDDGASATLIDAGFFGELFQLRRLLRRLKLEPSAIQAILLTHGHLDHACNLAFLRGWTGARVWAHAEERAHVEGRYPYRGINRVCGWLEAAGRTVLRYRVGQIDSVFVEGDVLPYWGGLRVMHLPGHTCGHCGFYSERHNLLFSGDLFASYFFTLHLPPPILNSVPDLYPASLRRVVELNPRWIIPNHYDWFDGALHRRRFQKLCGRLLKEPARKG
jgi:glyoxylase-like metal-dependent hydrolase (beta-lactamase superfamily II)